MQCDQQKSSKLLRPRGATIGRLTPDQKVVCSNHVGVTALFWTSLVAQTVKHLSTMQETRVQSVGREDLLEKEMATHSGVLAWKIPRTEEPGRLPSTGLQRV